MYEIAADWTLVTPPTIEPLSLAEAKQHAVIVQTDDDVLISAYIVAARQAAESYLGRGLLTQTWRLQLSAWADAIALPMAAPLQSAPTAPLVQYYDQSGVLQTLATSFYIVDTTSEPGRILRAPNQILPFVQYDRLDAITITYVCGWTAAAQVPELIKHGLRLYIAAQDADRTGGDASSETARQAAAACWRTAGPIYWRPPVCLP
jgi:uncharacterized phiE125 gp8 family phage protein